MKKEDLLIEKDNITKEILKLRGDLKIANDSVQNAGNTVSFYKVVTPPLIISSILGLLLSNTNLLSRSEGLVGIIILVFAISLLVTSKISQKKVKENKEKYKKERIAIQKLLVKKSKRIAEIESELKLIENWYRLSIILAVRLLEC